MAMMWLDDGDPLNLEQPVEDLTQYPFWHDIDSQGRELSHGPVTRSYADTYFVVGCALVTGIVSCIIYLLVGA